MQGGLDRRQVLIGSAALLGAGAMPLSEGGVNPVVTKIGEAALRYQELPLYTRLTMACDWLGWDIGIVFGSSHAYPEPRFIVDSVAEWVEPVFDAGTGHGCYFFRNPGTRAKVVFHDDMLGEDGQLPRLQRAMHAAEQDGYHYRVAL